MKAARHRHVLHHPVRRVRGGFTLIELLATMGIVLTLVALAYSGLAKMSQAGRRVVAMHNLSQLQLANTSYATDNNDRYVSVYVFDDKGASYVAWLSDPKFLSYLKGEQAVYLANGRVDPTLPLSMLDPAVVSAKKTGSTNVSASFGYNYTGMPGISWAQPNGNQYFRASQLTTPSRSAAFMSCTDWIAKFEGRFLWQGAAAVEGKTGDGKIALRYDHKALVVYYDGHIGAVSLADLQSIDQNGGANNIFWKANAP